MRACRTAGLEVAPNCLMLCLKRFGGQRFGKISRRIQFGEQLDLGQYLVAGGMDPGPAQWVALLCQAAGACCLAAARSQQRAAGALRPGACCCDGCTGPPPTAAHHRPPHR